MKAGFLKELREFRKRYPLLTVRDVAERMGVSASTVHRWLSGQVKPSPRATRVARQAMEEFERRGRERALAMRRVMENIDHNARRMAHTNGGPLT